MEVSSILFREEGGVVEALDGTEGRSSWPDSAAAGLLVCIEFPSTAVECVLVFVFTEGIRIPVVLEPCEDDGVEELVDDEGVARSPEPPLS